MLHGGNRDVPDMRLILSILNIIVLSWSVVQWRGTGSLNSPEAYTCTHVHIILL